MTELSREQIESVRVLAQHYDGTPVELFGVPVRLICDMALRTQDAEAECERLREALRSAKSEFEKLAVPTDGVRLVDAALATPPPEGEPERHKWRDERCVKCGDKDWRAGPVCPGAPHTPEKAESYPLDSEGRCLKCGGTGRIGVDSTREPCPACTSLPSQQAHGDALAALNRIALIVYDEESPEPTFVGDMADEEFDVVRQALASAPAVLNRREIFYRLANYESDEPYEGGEDQPQFSYSRYVLDQWLVQDHRGDCTNEPFTCMRCFAERCWYKAGWIAAAPTDGRE